MHILLITVAVLSSQTGCLTKWNTSNGFMAFSNSSALATVQIFNFTETTTFKSSEGITSYDTATPETPTSPAPTTENPTMAIPTSEAPSTETPSQAPTTVIPSQAPSTETPSQAPTTVIPSQAPSTETPSQAPTTVIPSQAPSTETPSPALTTEKPTSPAPTTENSTSPAPSTETQNSLLLETSAETTEARTDIHTTTADSPDTTTEVSPGTTTKISPETITEVLPETTTEYLYQNTTEDLPETDTEVYDITIEDTTEISPDITSSTYITTEEFASPPADSPDTTTEVSPGTTTKISPETITEVLPETTTEYLYQNTTEDLPETDTEVYDITIEDTTEISPDITTEEFASPPAGGMSASTIVGTVIGSLAGAVLIILLAVWHFKSCKTKNNDECPLPLPPDGSEPKEAPPGDNCHPSTPEEQPRKNWAPLPPAPLNEDDTAKMFASDDTIMMINIDSPLFRIDETKAEDEIDIYGNVTLSEKLRALTPFQYELGADICTGKFAVIKLTTLKDTVPHQRVAAKMAKNEDSLRDAVILRGKLNFLATEMTEHPNIVNFIAADLAVPMIFMDLCDGGSLTDWVQVIHFVTPAVKDAMMYFSYDIICGLEHLHGLKVLHRRLGIRNVLLGSSPERKIAKITGYGPLEKETDAEENDGEVPVRWLPPESLDRLPGKPRSYSEAVDMWSFGVTIWEIYSRTEQPFEGCDLPQLKEQLKKGDRLLKPRDCPKLLFESVVQPCWSFEPLIRPSAKHVRTALSKMTSSGTDIGTSTKSMTKEVTDLIKMHEYESRSSTVGDKDNSNLEVYEIMIDSEPEDYAKLNKLYQNEDKEGYTPLTQDMTNSEPEDYAKLNKLYQNEDNIGYTSLTQDTKDATVQEKDKNDASSSDDKPEEETYEYISILF